jgi:hypothetical protein
LRHLTQAIFIYIIKSIHTGQANLDRSLRGRFLVRFFGLQVRFSGGMMGSDL